MAARTFTSAGVNNLWSNAANWDGGVAIPVDNDSIVIPSGQTCEFDSDTSAFVNGIAGITINGTLSLTRTAGVYYMKLKAATTIGGTGTFDTGSLASPIPFAAKHTVTGGSGWNIYGGSGLTMTVYDAEPAIKTVLLTQNEAAGATVLHVDTDVTGDIWAAGDTIRIDNVNKGINSEARVIAAGGIAAGTITITAGLTGAKIVGTVVSLITRNLRFVGVGSSGVVVQNFASGKLTIAGGEWTTASYRAINGSTVNISGGTFHGNSIAVNSCTGTISGGVFSGNTHGLQYCGITISGGSFSGNGYAVSGALSGAAPVIISGGTFSGNTYCLNSCEGATVAGGTFSGNNAFISGGFGITVLSGTITNNTYGVISSVGAIIFGGVFSGHYRGLSASSVLIKNATFTGNTADIVASPVTAFNTLFGSSTENLSYTSFSRETYSESYDHDQVAGAYKAWTKGGVTSSQAVTVPTGLTQAMETVLENATVEGYWQKEVTVGAGASVNITSYLRKAASMTYLPRVIIFNKASTDPFAGGEGLHTFTMTNSIDTWESDVYTYTNTGSADVTLVIRTLGMAASGSVYSVVDVEQINVDLTAALVKLDAILVDTGTDIPAAITAIPDSVVEGTVTIEQALRLMLSALAGKASGGGTTTVTFRDMADNKNRIVATVDANGNRTDVVLDVT